MNKIYRKINKKRSKFVITSFKFKQRTYLLNSIHTQFFKQKKRSCTFVQLLLGSPGRVTRLRAFSRFAYGFAFSIAQLRSRSSLAQRSFGFLLHLLVRASRFLSVQTLHVFSGIKKRSCTFVQLLLGSPGRV